MSHVISPIRALPTSNMQYVVLEKHSWLLSLIPRSSDTRALGRAAVKLSASISYKSLLPSNGCLVVIHSITNRAVTLVLCRMIRFQVDKINTSHTLGTLRNPGLTGSVQTETFVEYMCSVVFLSALVQLKSEDPFRSLCIKPAVWH